jgi:hypothetical protein
MTRVMIDATHNGLAVAMPVIKNLPGGSVVALYDTGSAGIDSTPGDVAEIPSGLHKVFIDQGFTGSPNMSANVRDCENGAWSVTHAVDKTGWHVSRPTLYLGFPDTAQEAANAGWKGDVWLVHSQPSPPTAPPTVPAGLNVVAQQWNFTNPNFDESVVFDATWPLVAAPKSGIQDGWRWCHKCQGLFWGGGAPTSHCPSGGLHVVGSATSYNLPWTQP